jgi:hypothetical protein
MSPSKTSYSEGIGTEADYGALALIFVFLGSIVVLLLASICGPEAHAQSPLQPTAHLSP